MLKKIMIFAMAVVFISLLAACTSEGSADHNSESEVKAFMKEYKTFQYTVEDPKSPPTVEAVGENVKPYLSTEEYEKQLANRVFDIPAKVAAQTNKSISLEDITLEQLDSEGDESKYKYILHLALSDNDHSEMIERQGEVTITHGEEMKITRDWENRINKIEDITF